MSYEYFAILRSLYVIIIWPFERIPQNVLYKIPIGKSMLVNRIESTYFPLSFLHVFFLIFFLPGGGKWAEEADFLSFSSILPADWKYYSGLTFYNYMYLPIFPKFFDNFEFFFFNLLKVGTIYPKFQVKQTTQYPCFMYLNCLRCIVL